MTRRRVVLAPSASVDVGEIVDHLLATRDVGLAMEVDDRNQEALDSLEQHAERGRLVPELRTTSRFREVLALPHRVIYRVDAREVIVVAVLDHRRHVEALLQRRLRRHS
jgi:toxin ParE1/3/4